MSWFENGISRIYYETYGSGDPVLLLPGLFGRSEELSAVREALVATGYRVIAADLPGSGRSEPQPRNYTATYLKEDAKSFAALLQHLKLAAAHLVGFSDGGEVSLLMATVAPGAARSVVTWGSAGMVSDPSGQLRQVLFNVVDAPIPPMQGFRDYLIDVYGESNARIMTRNVVNAMNQIIEGGGDVSLSKADNIACPVLLIAGEHDPFAPPALVTQLAARLQHGEMLTVEGAGHDIHHSHSGWLIQTVLGWLEGK